MRRFVVVLALLLVTGCSGPPPAASPSDSPQAADEKLTLLAFGDSWPFGAHCNGCVPFPQLYADGLEEQTGEEIEFLNLVTNGGTTGTLRDSITQDSAYRDAVKQAEIIIISTGANDMEVAAPAWESGQCGGADGLDCFRDVAETWTENFDAMLTEIDSLRAGEPTAIRVIGNSNEFLYEPGLIEYFGPEFGLTGGATITAMHNDAACTAAQDHGAQCLDLRPVLNGPSLDQPRDVNSQDSMQAVADALLATGLPELGR